MTRVFLVDDHAIMREALRELLNSLPDVLVCGEAESGRDALEQIEDVRPDLVLVDGSLPDMSGIDVVAHLRERQPALPSVMVSRHRERNYVQRALQAGGRGYVVKRDADELPEAIRKINDGQIYLSRSAREHMPDST